jgi:hypothetical protein
MLKQARSASKGIGAYLANAPVYGFSVKNLLNQVEIDESAEGQFDVYKKRMRQIFLDRSILPRTKMILPALRIRKVEDTLEKLRGKNECAGIFFFNSS